MFNNILPMALITLTIFTGSFSIWCIGIGADPNYFFEWLPMVVSAALFVAAMWGLSMEGVSGQHYSE